MIGGRRIHPMQDRELTRILILAACPSGTEPLRFDQEFRDIQDGLESAKTPFTVRLHLSTRPADLSREILKFKPHLIHFCGHGDPESGILLEDESGAPKPVSGEALASLFKLFADLVKCVVLNCCYSRSQAEAIAQYVAFVVGMNGLIGDDAAIAFSVGFYEALGEGKCEGFAFEYGLARMQLEGFSEEKVPEIFLRPIQLATPASAAPELPGSARTEGRVSSDRTRELIRKMFSGLFVIIVLGAGLLQESLPRPPLIPDYSSRTERARVSAPMPAVPLVEEREIPSPPIQPVDVKASASANKKEPSSVDSGRSASPPSNRIEVTGVGFSPPGVEGERGKSLARRAAEVEARRNLAAIIGTRIQTNTTVVNGTLQKDQVEATVDEFVRGARVKKERPLQDGGYEITLEADLPWEGTQ